MARKKVKADWTASTHPLAKALLKRGITQRQFAEKVGVPQADISRVLTGRRERFSAGVAEKVYPAVKGWKIKLEDLVFPHGA